MLCTRSLLLPVAFLAAFVSTSLRAWDYAGHQMVNRLGLASLPPDFPDFVRDSATQERIAFLAGEPDRWKNVSDLAMRHSGGSWSEHFLDLEQIPLAGLDVATLPSLRYQFAVAFAAGRAANAHRFPKIDPARNADRTREWPGFAPWGIAEYYAKLKSAFSYLRAFEENGTPDEVANAKANAIYVMGVMGHFVGDLAQPLHTTDHYNGWVGPNPNGYTTRNTLHSWIDGGFIRTVGIKLSDISPRAKPARVLSADPRPDNRDPLFVAVMDYLLAQHAQVELLYRLEKAGKLNADTGDVAEGRAFIEGQLLRGGEMLGSLWLSAYRHAGPDVYLRTELARRNAHTAVPDQK